MKKPRNENLPLEILTAVLFVVFIFPFFIRLSSRRICACALGFVVSPCVLPVVIVLTANFLPS